MQSRNVVLNGQQPRTLLSSLNLMEGARSLTILDAVAGVGSTLLIRLKSPQGLTGPKVCTNNEEKKGGNMIKKIQMRPSLCTLHQER